LYGRIPNVPGNDEEVQIMSEQGAGRKRVAVTGSSGLIGRLVLDAWRDSRKYEVIGVGRSEGPYVDAIADVTDLDALVAAFQGADAVVHLAATSAVDSGWDAVLHSNLVGTRNVFEAARLAGVRQVVFASSNHAVGTYELENVPELWDLGDMRQWDHEAEIRPDSYYGVSKVYGEAMARYYVDHHGMRAVCLRIGGVRAPDDPTHPSRLWKRERDGEEGIREKRRRMRAVWLSERDCVHLIDVSLETGLDWVLAYGISDNPRKIWDIEHAKKVLGYAPMDAAPEEIMPGEVEERKVYC
jgi:nucleoside-diphosphate-sugar epimerase